LKTSALSTEKKHEAEFLYLILAGIFIASLVSCNLIFQKFFYWYPMGFPLFEISVGILPYPITFLVTDIISEIYGQRRANAVVTAGLVASIFVLGVVSIANIVPATTWSPVNSELFTKVFGLTGVSVGASMCAYLLAQYIDIRVFHFWKKVTNGKHLWVRNNASTLTSQLVDTAVVLVLLCSMGVIDWSLFWPLFGSGYLFKALVALIDTPFMYFFTWLIRKRLGLVEAQEVVY
jgi:uncharacterized integral membrane protein (TIGR00697 family)